MNPVIRDRLLVLVCTALACVAAGASSAGALSGSAAFRERMMVPPDAVFEAQLQDNSRADAPAAVLGRARLDPAVQLPFRFEITYDNGAAKPGGLGKLPASFEGELPGAGSPIRWHLDLYPEGRFQLRITHVGRPAPNQFDDIGRWSQERDSGRIVLRGGREAHVFLLPADGGAALRKLDLQGKPIESALNDRLRRQPRFAPIEPRLLPSGMFTYMADAANIVLCADNGSMPVAMEADYKAL